MKITSITIEQLFGGDTPYHLDLTSPEGVIILHAQNGMGKTTVLSMIPAILHADFIFLNSTPFKKATLEFNDGSYVSVEKNSVFESVLEYDDNEETEFVFNDDDTMSPKQRRRKNEIKYTLFRHDEKKISSVLIPPRPEVIRNGKMPEEYTLRSGRYRMAGNLFGNREFLEHYIEIVREVSINFIKADRLYINSYESRRMRGRRYLSESEQEGNIKVEAITECAWDLKERIFTYKRRKEEVSESLDRTFPKRVIELYKNKQNKEVDVIRTQLQELENKRKELEKIGLIGDDRETLTFSSNEEFPPDSLPVLEIYIEDNKQKLAAYDKLKAQIDLLLKAINESNVFTKKKLVINIENSSNRFAAPTSQYAMKFITDDGREIPLERLSSGEKHAVILFYNLIFNSKNGSLVMIDEPEISLHISWQQHFISSLIEICKENQLYAVVATHSPDIVGNHWDLLVNLDGSPTDADDEEE